MKVLKNRKLIQF